MRRPTPTRTLLLAALVLVLGAGAPDRAEQLDAYVAQAVEDWEVPGLAISVVKDGEVVFSSGYGTRELGTDAPVDGNTLFAIGSTTKAMTAAAIGMLVDEGLLSWDSKVTDLLPGFALADPWVTRELTVRDLLTHRAGLGNADFLWYRNSRGAEDILRRARFIEPAYSMRSSFIYQNIMYAAAGGVIEAVSAMPWAQFVHTRIFAPLGMDHTVPLHAETLSRDNVARPHDTVDGILRVIDNAPVDSVAAAGAVWSGVDDMARWMTFMLEGGKVGDERLLQPETHAELLEPQVIVPPSGFYPTAELTQPHWTTYALGWFQHDYQGRAVSFHTGSIDGMVAIIGLIPDERLGVYVLANRDHAELRHALMYRAFDLWAPHGDSGRDWSTELLELYRGIAERAAASQAESLAAIAGGAPQSLPDGDYAGTYADILYGEITVDARGGQLDLRVGDLQGVLEHANHDTFQARWSLPWMDAFPVTFRLGTDGRVHALELLGRTFRRR